MSEPISAQDFNPDKPKTSAIPQFYVEPVNLEHQSKLQGRPIFEDREFVKIISPGDRRTMVVEPVNDDHKARWPEQYKAFKEGREAPLEGTPLSEWAVSGMTRARVEELAYFHIRTVEQMAEVNDNQIGNLGMGARELRDRAKLWLDVAAKGSAVLDRMQTDAENLKAENQRLKDQMAELAAEVRSLTKKDAA